MQWVFKRAIVVNDIQKQFYWESVMSDILLQFNWESKNTLTSIDFYLRIGTGIIDKLLLLKSLGDQKKHWYGMRTNWSLKEQLMWNDIQKQFHWESNQLICN